MACAIHRVAFPQAPLICHPRSKNVRCNIRSRANRQHAAGHIPRRDADPPSQSQALLRTADSPRSVKDDKIVAQPMHLHEREFLPAFSS